ncbi:MAG: P-II family nitrogen regulator [gamma proteobacterium symbiont of Lucinoma myriamae]|nr:P-II family nitrogen regulator [gamma proteobacterium symbiont of Lucinoma myriamae]MCU7819618.1 P-II family nitrogen regulator [gamma proteobacterium symbiont of Lucinoma myriamae]MCU7833412.1 P-II family nitrogen regulator [gamma proteobacterium symbiont of Lucinoma myriamae]
MSVKNIVYLTDVSQITCVVQEGLGDVILKAARELGVSLGARLYHAKGTGARELFGLLGVAVETEKDVVSVLVSAEQRDIVFDALYLAADLDTPGKGFMYITQLEKLATYLPENFLNSSEDSNG